MSNNLAKLKVGDIVICVKPESFAYKRDKEYTVVEQMYQGNMAKGLVADDGFFDPFSMMCSFFKPVDVTTKAVRHLKVV